MKEYIIYVFIIIDDRSIYYYQMHPASFVVYQNQAQEKEILKSEKINLCKFISTKAANGRKREWRKFAHSSSRGMRKSLI